MVEPINTEQLAPLRLTVGETPVYLKNPLDVDGKQVTELTIKGTSTRGKDGIESSVLLLKDQSRRRGEEGQTFTKPLTNVSAMEEVDWEKVGGVQYAMPDGSVHTITKDQLSLIKPSPERSPQSPLPAVASAKEGQSPLPADLSAVASAKVEASAKEGPSSSEPALARSILETYSGEPTTLTIVGLKVYETRAHDLADRAMQLKTSLGDRIWKQGVGPAYFHERARQYYDAMLKAAHSPFAESSIKIAEAAGKNRYQDLLNNKNFLTRPTRRFIEWMKDTVGAQTLAQKFALEEIAHMRETGEIKERETFNREAGAIRKRFEQDVDIQEQFIRGTLGEKLTILNPDDPAYKPMVDVIKGLVKGYATGDIATKKDFDNLTDELFQKHLKTARRDVFDQAELYTSSLFEVAEQLRAKAGHEGGLAAIDAQLDSMQVRLGMGVMGEATALVPSDVEKGTKAVMKAVEWMEKKGIIGPFAFNEATVGTAVALSLSLSFLPRAGISGLANGLAGLGAGSVVFGVFGGLREYRNLEKEYLTHIRERESGLTFAPDAKRRAWMETFMVGQRSADDLITQIRTPLYESDGKTLRAALTTDELRSSMAHLADAKARRALSGRTDGQRVGLIQFTGRDNIETQRTSLDVTIAQAEKDLTTYFTAHPEVTGPGPVNQTAGEFLTQLTVAQTRILTDGINKIGSLDDPIRLTLNALDAYNPEVDIMRRRFPLIGADQKTGAKAQGLEEIFKEFRRAAAGEAVKKGLQVGLSSAAIGWVSREVMQAGVNAGWEATHPTDQVKTVFNFSGERHLLDNPSGGQAILAPKELHWDVIRGGRQLILDTHDARGNLIKQVLHTQNGTPDNNGPSLFEIIGKEPRLAGGIDLPAGHPHLAFTPEESTMNVKLPHEVTLPILAPVKAEGVPLSLHASIPEGTNLVETPTPTGLPAGIKVFDLVDNQGKKLLTDIQINNYGVVQSYHSLNATDLARANSLNVTMEQMTVSTASPETGGAVGGTFVKAVKDMGSTPNEHGVWNWMLETIRADKDVKHLLPATNLTKNLFRGYEEVMKQKDNIYLDGVQVQNAIGLPYGAMGDNYAFHDLPKSLFFDQPLPNGKIPLVELGKIMDEAIKMKEVDGTELANMDKLHQAAYEIGRVGRVATKDEVEMFMRHMGDVVGPSGKETTTTIWRPVIEQVTTETIPATIVGIPGEVSAETFSQAPELLYWPSPLLWRTPLEAPVLHAMPGILPPEFTPPQYFTYGGEQVFLTKNEYEDRRSPRLTDKDVKLNQQEELAWYPATLSEEDKAHLEVLLAQHADPVPDSAKAVIAIPANKEGLNIYTTLTQYAKQKDLKDAPLDPHTYQIVIYDNRVKGTSADATRTEVMRFKNEHPEMNIVYLEQVLDQKPTIGRVRRNLTNSILKRLETRDPALPQVAIISNDADSVHIPDRYVATIMDTFAHNARLDAITGRYDFPQEVYKNYPVLFATERAWQLMDAIVRHNEQSSVPQLMGANSAVQAGTLAAIGGYNPKSTLGEDLEVGWMIQTARQSDPTRFHFSNALKLETDPRRAIYKYLQGAGLLDRYTDFADNTEIRGLSWQEMATRAEEAYSREKLAESLTRMRSELYPWLKKSNPEALDRYFKRAMDFLGVTFELQGDNVTITDDSVLRAGINVNLTPEQIVRNEPIPLPPTATPLRPLVLEASAL